MNWRVFILSMILLLAAKNNALAQQNSTLKPPALQSFWGYYKGGAHPLSVVQQMADTAIWVIDSARQPYAIRSFRINYFSYDSYEDEQTGKIKTKRNLQSKEFQQTNMLSDLWRQFLFESLKPKDEILIDLISVKDRKGNIFYAPDIKIVVQ